MKRLSVFSFFVLSVFLAPGVLVPLSAAEDKSAEDWVSTPEQWKKLSKGEVLLLVSQTDGKGAGHSATAAILVDAPRGKVWDVVYDSDAAAGFQDSLVSSQIVEETESYALVEQVVKVGFHKAKYVVRQKPDRPDAIVFERESGDMKEIDGFWRFFTVVTGDEEKTLAVYRLSLKPDIPLPGFLVRKSIATNIPDTLYSVRDEVIRRQSEGS